MADRVSSAADARAATDRYVVVARRYRPRGFDQLVGQDHVAKALANAIQTNRVGHAYLFTGARGVGKTSTARIFAKALNAPGGPTLTPDDSSDVCQAIDAGEDIDVLEIDGASNRGIDEIRQLRAGVGVRPSRSRYKIYIIDEVHMLTMQAFNALLKTLEEPPEHVKFIFCTTDPEKLPITVLSRCQRFDFAPVRVEQIADRLREIVDAEKVEADDEALRLLARRAAGSMRDSQSLLEQMLSFSSGRLTVDLVHSMLGTADDARMTELAEALSARDSRSALELVDAAILGGVDPGQLAEQLLGFFRDMMAATVGCDAEMLRFCGPSMHARLAEQGRETGLQTVLGIVGLLDQTLVRIRQSVHSQVLLEAALVQICSLPDLQSLAALASGLAGVSMPVSGRGSGGARGGQSAASEEKKKIERQSAVVSNVAPSGSSSALRHVPKPKLPGVGASDDVGGRSTAVASGASVVGVVSASDVGAPRPTQGAVEVSDHRGAERTAERRIDPVVPVTAPWNPATAEVVWKAALGAMDDITADFARQALAVEAVGSGRIRLTFDSSRELAKQSCEKPERKTKLEAAIRAVSARDVLIEFETKVSRGVDRPESGVQKPSTAVARRQRMREAEQHPVVRQVMELFDAEIVRVDEPQSET